MNTSLTAFQEEVRARFDEKFVWRETELGDEGREFVVGEELRERITLNELRDILTSSTTEAYVLGQQNPKVGFLRQFLNESPDWKGKLWTDEDLLRFIRVAKPVEPQEDRYVLGLKRALELLPDEIPSPKRQCLNAESHLFGQCFECAKNKGFNRARTEIETALSAELTSLEKRV